MPALTSLLETREFHTKQKVHFLFYTMLHSNCLFHSEIIPIKLFNFVAIFLPVFRGLQLEAVKDLLHR